MPVGFPGCKGGSSLNYLIRNAMSCDLPAVSDASLWRSSPNLDTGAKASGGFPVPYPHSLQQATKVLDMTATSVVIFRMTLGSQLRPPASLLPTSNARPCVIRSVIQTQIAPLFSTAYNIPFQQLLSFDIDTTLPRGGMSGLARFSTPAKRALARPLCKSSLYFQQLTNCLFAKSFSLIRIQTAPGGGGVSFGT